jgi:purine-cytosine permease-like protein
MTAIARLLVVLILTLATVMAADLALFAPNEPSGIQWVFWLVFALATASCVLGASKTLRCSARG